MRLLDDLGKLFNDSHRQSTQRGHRGTDEVFRFGNIGSLQLRSVPAKSVCSFDTGAKRSASQLLVSSDIDADRLVNLVVAGLQPRNKRRQKKKK